jgi:hypothetical protein
MIQETHGSGDALLFHLDAERRYRLSHDANQWIIERRVGTASPGGSEASDRRESGFRGVWHVGSEKRVLEGYIEGARPPLPESQRPRIMLTPEAAFRLEALPDRFVDFQVMAVQSSAA